jgi:Leucine-rich repeat (LRR) protein
MKELLLLAFLYAGLTTMANAQTTAIPDTNFRKFLAERFPTFLNTNKELINSRAAAYVGSLDCSFRNIHNLSGIEKFSNLNSLSCYNNQLTNLDSIGKLTNITSIYCFNNRLTKLPNLSKFNQLNYLSCGNNQLIELPDLSNNTLITYLDCSRNQISEIRGLDKLVNLQTLFIFENQISKLPELSNLGKLTIFQCHENKLSEIPGIDKLVQLTTLFAGANPLSATPNLSALTKMQVLVLWKNQLTTCPDISKMKSLTILDLNDNQITQLPNLDNNTALTIIRAVNNQLDSLPNLSKITTLKALIVGGNRLTKLPSFFTTTNLDSLLVHNNLLSFEDLFLPSTVTISKYYGYAPQKTLGTPSTQIVSETKAFTFPLSIDQGILSNKYTWFKNGEQIQAPNKSIFEIDKLVFSDSGTYSCTVTNPALPMLTLQVAPTTLKVGNCLDLSSFTYQPFDYECNIGGRLLVNENSLKGGEKPYKFSLSSKNTTATALPNGNLFSNLQENDYTLWIKDKNGCLASRDIQIKGKKPEDCQNLVIVADNNGTQNSLYFEEKGTAKIYDKSGKLVRSFSTPASWDGTLDSGELVPGLYAIEHNNKNLSVTVIK